MSSTEKKRILHVDQSRARTFSPTKMVLKFTAMIHGYHQRSLPSTMRARFVVGVSPLLQPTTVLFRVFHVLQLVVCYTLEWAMLSGKWRSHNVPQFVIPSRFRWKHASDVCWERGISAYMVLESTEIVWSAGEFKREFNKLADNLHENNIHVSISKKELELERS